MNVRLGSPTSPPPEMGLFVPSVNGVISNGLSRSDHWAVGVHLQPGHICPTSPSACGMGLPDCLRTFQKPAGLPVAWQIVKPVRTINPFGNELCVL